MPSTTKAKTKKRRKKVIADRAINPRGSEYGANKAIARRATPRLGNKREPDLRPTMDPARKYGYLGAHEESGAAGVGKRQLLRKVAEGRKKRMKRSPKYAKSEDAKAVAWFQRNKKHMTKSDRAWWLDMRRKAGRPTGEEKGVSKSGEK